MKGLLYTFIKNVKSQIIRNTLFLFFLSIGQIIHVRAQLIQNNFYLNNEIKFERLAIENGFSNNISFGMTQDKNGFMWFATLDALIKYDGYTLVRYQNNPQDTNSLGDNIVMSVFEDHTGLIWVGTAGGGGVNSFDPQTLQWKRYPHDPKIVNSMGKGSIEGIAEDRSGMLWFGSTDGLTRYNPKTNQFTLFENNPKDKYSLSNNRVYSIVEDTAGMLWIGTDLGINLFDPKQERFFLVNGDFKDSLLLQKSVIHHIYKDHQGLLWLSSYDHGVFVIDPGLKKCLAHYTHDPKNTTSVGSDVVMSITQDQTGSYWVSTEGGLYLFNPQTKMFTLYENKSYLPKTETKGHCIMTDRAGLVWIGTVGRGVIYFSPEKRKFRRYLNDEASLAFGLGSNRIKSMFNSGDSHLYVATSQNLLKFNRVKDVFEVVWQLKTIKRNNEHFILTTACEEKPGIFWLGTDQAGILIYNAHTSRVTNLQNNPLDSASLATNWVNVLYRDQSGRLWVGTEGGALQWYNPVTKKFVRYRYLSSNEEAPINPGIRFIYEDSKGDLWLGIKAFHMALGGNGLYQIHLKTGDIKHYKHEPGVSRSLSNNSVTCLYEDREGIFWIGTYGGGLNRLNATSGEITVYTKENGLLSNTVEGLASDTAGNLWIKADEGITRFNSTTLSTKQFGSSDGLATSPIGVESEDYNAYLSIESKEGSIFFGSNNGYNGLIAFDPGLIQENNFKPTIAIIQFKVFDKSYPITGKEIVLRYDQNFLDIEFAALSYLSSGKNQYAYKLEGVDHDWVNNGSSRIAHYTNIIPGKHVFRVKGSNNDGVWNEQDATLTIIINPPWWRTWWAYTLYGLFIIGSIWAIIHYRSLTLIRQKRLLEKEVATRTAEVVHQKEELQNTLEDLKTTQTQLIQSEKMASLGALTAGIAHEIQNPLNFVNNFSEVNGELIKELEEATNNESRDRIYEADILTNLKENSEKINHHGKRADAIVKSMLQHSRGAEMGSKKEPTDINALAVEYFRLAYHSYKSNHKDSPDIKLITDFDAGLPLVNVIPQDIGRVLLNLFNNAFWAVNEKGKNFAGLPEINIKDQRGLSDGETTNQDGSNNPPAYSNPASPAGRRQDYFPSVTLITKYLNNQSDNYRIEIHITDNGPGIPQSIIDKIFQPFFTTKPTGQGTGLGLSLAYDIVKAHNGDLSVISEEGQGSEFIIQLPNV